MIFGIAAAILAYFLGYYDLTFLDRYKLLMSDRAPGQTNETVSKDSGPGVQPPSSLSLPNGGNSTGSQTDGNPSSSDGTGDSGETGDRDGAGDSDGANHASVTSVLSVTNTDLLPDALLAMPTVAELTEAGVYTPTAEPYDGSRMRLARLSFDYQLPTAYSLRKRVTERLTYVVPYEYAPYEAQYLNVREERPAIELYMGYLLLDHRDAIYVISSDGTPLCSYSDDVYRPAYARDKNDRPLFCREDGTGATRYFTLSEDGRNFVASDYNEKTDGRGLSFDYPAEYGKPAANDAPPAVRNWSAAYGRYAYLTEQGSLTSYSFTEAYPYVEGRACVVTSSNRGGMYFLDETGARVQQTFVRYLRSEYNRYSIWDYAMPASRGVESLGFFYYDHGLTRVRYQIIDWYNWTYYRRVRAVSDEDILIRTDGSRYPLPAGYTLKGYSEGMILLEKDGLYGFMDYTGGWIAEPCYVSATPFLSGLSVLETTDHRFGMIDREGNIVLPFTYDSLSQSSSGVIAAYREENGWTVFRVMGK